VITIHHHLTGRTDRHTLHGPVKIEEKNAMGRDEREGMDGEERKFMTKEGRSMIA